MGNAYAWSDLTGIMQTTLLSFGGSSITVGSLLATLVLVAALWLLFGLTKRMFTGYVNSHPDMTPATVYTVSRVVRYVFFAVGTLLALDVMGVPLGHLAIFTGALGVGLGFGLKQIFTNFVSGLILLFDRSLKVGDFVELDAGISGRIRAINIRYTCITTNDDVDVLVPNSDLINGRVMNWTHNSLTRRLIVPFGVAYCTPKEKVSAAAIEAAGRVSFTAELSGEKAPCVWLTGFGDSAVNYALVVWLNEQGVRQYRGALAAYLWEIDTSLHQYGIELPFPQRDLRVRSLFGLEGDEALAVIKGNGAASDAPRANR